MFLALLSRKPLAPTYAHMLSMWLIKSNHHCISNYELNKVLSRGTLYVLSTALSAGPSVFTGSNQFSDWRKAASVHYRYPMRSQGFNVSFCGISLMLVKALTWEALV